ncbi:MAG TPA: hypothetical protein VK765_05510 [Solirubrobacteraceae bacterium]|jgi:hypothetical protein|nr:hypothetical protein [Solirubrobacteraceae bacterium]
MYQFSRAIYRELAPLIDNPAPGSPPATNQAAVLHACEAVITRLATDRHYFARPARTLFLDIRSYFPMSAQSQVHRVITRYMGYAQLFLAEHPHEGYTAVSDAPPQCRATTRKGSACQRTPLPHNGYCPSHQHLADTENRELAAA